MSDNIITNFPVTIYGNLERYSDTISKGRCRIFYKYGNRNGTYITDDFAEKLLASIPYAPVKGIYDDLDDDYTDHGVSRTEGRIYGIVPENPNLAWEPHVDEDGVERVYACVDVYLYTALYSEANIIIGKSQSMELYPKTIKGDWKIIDGRRYYVFEEGSFLGLQALGDDVEPCFEGAAFFSLYKDMKKIVDQIEKYNLIPNGGKKMKLNYKLSDNAKFNALWSLLNVNFSEENNWTVEYDICEIYDDYAVVKNYAEGIYERVFYTKNDDSDSVEINNRERCYIMDVSENEKTALEALHGLNNGTYEKVDENYSNAVTAVAESENKVAELAGQVTDLEGQVATLNSTLEEEKTNSETKIGELNNSIATLTTERDNAATQLVDAQLNVNNLTEEVANLNSFKANVEKKEKEAIIKKYSALIDEKVLEDYSLRMDDFDAVSLNKELAYELVSTNAEVFSKNPQLAYTPKENPNESGLNALLSQYKKN